MRRAFMPSYLLIALGTLGIVLLLLASVTGPLVAQDGTAFATNTPPPPTPITLTVEAPVDFYGLRLWLERDLLEILFEQIQHLSAGEADAQTAVQVTLYELERRFPGAPTRLADRERLLAAMLTAPRGTVDMRGVVQPLIEAELNRNPNSSQFTYDGFNIEVMPFDVDGIEPIDAFVHVAYSRNALFEVYMLAQRSSNGVYTIVPAESSYPAAPFGELESIGLYGTGDTNRDGLEDFIIIQNEGQFNQRMRILSFRNNQVVDLVAPGEQIRFGEIVDWPISNVEVREPKLKVIQLRQEDTAWGCLSELPVTWAYSGNFYRPSVAVNVNYTHQDSLACSLYTREPLFAMPTADAIDLVNATILEYNQDEPGYQRALMVLAMLQALNGQRSDAVAIAQAIQPASGETQSWIGSQTATFLQLMSASGNSALDVCEGLVRANEDAACDLNAYLGLVFSQFPLSTEEPLINQLEQRGLPVLESIEITQVGRVPRTAISFNMAGTGWWAFAPRGGGNTYIAESIDPPGGFEETVFPQSLVETPKNAYTALFVNNDPASALNIIENAARNNPGIPLTPAAQYLRALSYDLTGDRAKAKAGYYEVWSIFPRTLWGQLAARHIIRQ